ncbi:hypothetical protein, partial [Klebsiella pneumoniae]|uniref:hypothetical protein n=1 Tax=Klebsiella pneumoniae TaxID=573 RepID=UPI0027311DF6
VVERRDEGKQWRVVWVLMIRLHGFPQNFDDDVQTYGWSVDGYAVVRALAAAGMLVAAGRPDLGLVAVCTRGCVSVRWTIIAIIAT